MTDSSLFSKYLIFDFDLGANGNPWRQNENQMKRIKRLDISHNQHTYPSSSWLLPGKCGRKVSCKNRGCQLKFVASQASCKNQNTEKNKLRPLDYNAKINPTIIYINIPPVALAWSNNWHCLAEEILTTLLGCGVINFAPRLEIRARIKLLNTPGSAGVAIRDEFMRNSARDDISNLGEAAQPFLDNNYCGVVLVFWDASGIMQILLRKGADFSFLARNILCTHTFLARGLRRWMHRWQTHHNWNLNTAASGLLEFHFNYVAKELYFPAP